MTKERALEFLDECCEVVERVNQINQKYEAHVSLDRIHIPLGDAEKVALAAQKTIKYSPSDEQLIHIGLIFFEHKGVEFFGGYYQ